MFKYRDSLAALLVGMILLTGGYCALKIGDDFSTRGQLKTLSFIIRITEHLHSSIDGLQKERAHALASTPEAKKLFERQVTHTD